MTIQSHLVRSCCRTQTHTYQTTALPGPVNWLVKREGGNPRVLKVSVRYKQEDTERCVLFTCMLSISWHQLDYEACCRPTSWALNPVYTIQPVECLFTRRSRLYRVYEHSTCCPTSCSTACAVWQPRLNNRLHRVNTKQTFNRLSIRLNVCLHDAVGCSTDLTTGCTVQTGSYRKSSNRIEVSNAGRIVNACWVTVSLPVGSVPNKRLGLSLFSRTCITAELQKLRETT